MHNDRPTVFRASLRAKPGQLAAIWLFLIILPFAVLTIVTEVLLKESETQLALEAKVKLNLELQDFRDNLSFSRMLDYEFNRLLSPTASATIDSSAEELADRVRQELGIGVLAVFTYQARREEFSSYVNPALKNDLGLVSRTMLKNLLIFHGGAAARPVINPDPQNSVRFSSYLRSLLGSAGELKLKPGKSVAAISGKPGLSRLLLYYCPFSGKSEVSSGHLLILRELDIPLKHLLASSKRRVINPGFKRLLTSTVEGWKAIYSVSPNHLEFSSSLEEGISLRALPSGEFLLRMVTDGSLYPARLAETVARLPVLQVVAPPATLVHPLRSTLSRARTPALILVLLASIVILHIHLFGFAGSLRIGPRLFISVLAASLLPFSTFIAAAAWHQRFLETFSRAEISQFIQLQADQINRMISASLNARELQLAALGKDLGNLNHAGAVAFLKKWLPENSASLIVYNQNGNEEIITRNKSDKLNELESDMKDLGFIAMQNSLKPVGPGGVSEENLLGMIKFKSKGLGLILETVGTLHNSLSNNLCFLYATFPIFAEDNRFAEPLAQALVRFQTRDLLAVLIKDKPEMIQNAVHGEYLVQNCFIPLELPTELPPPERAFCDANFNLQAVIQAAEKTAQTRSASIWADSNTHNIVTFLHNLSCILVIRATRQPTFGGITSLSVFQVIVYFLLIVGILVAFLRKALVEPIHILKIAAEKVAIGDYSQTIDFRSGDEFEPLTVAFNQMSAGLLQKERLSSYVSAEVMQEVEAESGINLQPGGERIEASILFVSLAGLKNFKNQEGAGIVTEAISNLIDTASEIAARHRGNIDKLVEDTLMLVFRQKESENGHVVASCRAALEISQAFSLNNSFKLRAGIASGPVVSGKIGSRHGKLDFTVIGNPVNLAARLKAQAGKTNETGIIICPATIRMLKGAARLRFIERTEIKGRSRTFPLYELLELR